MLRVTRLLEERPILHHISLRLPHPILPHALRRVVSLRHLLRKRVIRSDKPVSLAQYRRMLAPTNRVHFPPRVVVVNHVDESPPDTWHPLNQPLPKVVERHRYLHHLCCVRVYYISRTLVICVVLEYIILVRLL